MSWHGTSGNYKAHWTGCRESRYYLVESAGEENDSVVRSTDDLPSLETERLPRAALGSPISGGCQEAKKIPVIT